MDRQSLSERKGQAFRFTYTSRFVRFTLFIPFSKCNIYGNATLPKRNKLLSEIRSCTVCKDFLPNPPKPIIQASASSKIVIIGQAPGQKVQNSGIPWDDASGENLRAWLGVDKSVFYNDAYFALVPMGFCYPGTGKSGDLPPRKECAELRHKQARLVGA